MLSFSCSPARAARGSLQIAGHGWASYKVNCMTLGASRPARRPNLRSLLAENCCSRLRG